uniref:Uncharacterized protein n=1 Tax=Solanum tuberosum TaxID=4113 RepID=M1BQ75_SOLTU
MVLNLMSSMTIIRLSGSFIGILLMVLMGIMVRGLGTSFLYGMADGKRKSNRSQFIQQDLFGSDLPATGLRNKELSINKKEEWDAALLVPTGTEWND